MVKYKKGTRRIKYKCKNCSKIFLGFLSARRKFCSKNCFSSSGIARLEKKHTEDSKQKMRDNFNNNSKKGQFKIGHKMFPGSEKGWFKKGQHPSNWQGGKRTLSQKLKDDVRYKKWREAVFRRDNYTCQEKGCNEKRGCYLNAHHIKAKVKYLKLAFDINNGLTLCKECHKKTNNYGGKANKNIPT